VSDRSDDDPRRRGNEDDDSRLPEPLADNKSFWRIVRDMSKVALVGILAVIIGATVLIVLTFLKILDINTWI